MDPLNKSVRMIDFARQLNFDPSPTLENTLIKGLKIYKKKRKLIIQLISSIILKQEELKLLTKQLKQNIEFIKDVEIDIVYDCNYKDIGDLVELNWDNVVFLLKKEVPSITAALEKVRWEASVNLLSIIIDEPFILEKIKERKVEGKIEKYFNKYFKTNIKCEIRSEKDFVLTC